MKFSWKKIGMILGMSAAVLLAAAVVVLSQGPGPRPGGFPGGPGPRDGLGPLGRELNLTDDQKAQVKKIADSFRETEQALHDQLRTLHQSEPDPMSGAFDEAAVRAAAEARSKIQIELEVSHAKMMSQIAGVLTTEQKTQLAARHQQMRRMGPPPPPPPREEPF
jgi:Spy/CpxP family protein refolding chaperone